MIEMIVRHIDYVVLRLIGIDADAKAALPFSAEPMHISHQPCGHVKLSVFSTYTHLSSSQIYSVIP